MIKRNNPGNIVKSKNKWIGEIEGDQSRFASFDSLPYGFRAMIKLIQVYINRGSNTMKKIINIYAPPSENPTGNYIEFVSKKTGIDPNEPILKNDYSKLANIALAMATFEHGLKSAEVDTMKKHVLEAIQLILTGSTITSAHLPANTSGSSGSTGNGRKMIWIEWAAIIALFAWFYREK